MVKTCVVYNLASDEVKTYAETTPEQAVIAAYAQAHGDYNTWDYHKKYAHLVERGKLSVCCGDWACKL